MSQSPVIYMATLPSLNLNYQGTEVLSTEAANRQMNLDEKVETNKRQGGEGKRTQKWEIFGSRADI